MTDEQKAKLNMYKALATVYLEWIKGICTEVQTVTGESDMTADFIWGNCTLEQLEAHLESVKVQS